eukprot:jgi/Botrbrau1/21037/Bobra.0144s0048.1
MQSKLFPCLPQKKSPSHTGLCGHCIRPRCITGAQLMLFCCNKTDSAESLYLGIPQVTGTERATNASSGVYRTVGRKGMNVRHGTVHDILHPSEHLSHQPQILATKLRRELERGTKFNLHQMQLARVHVHATTPLS